MPCMTVITSLAVMGLGVANTGVLMAIGVAMLKGVW